MQINPDRYEVTVSATIAARYVRLFSENSVDITPIAVFGFEVYYMP